MKTKSGNRNSFGKRFWSQRQLMLMSLPFLAYVLFFNYLPALGWVIAFQDFRPRFGLGPIEQVMFNMEHNFVGLGNFRTLLDTNTAMGARFMQSVVNTFGQSILTLITGTIAAIVLSLMLNEVKQTGPKRIMQNILYMPHFLSWVIVASLASVALALPVSGGIINEILLWLRIIDEPILFLAEPNYFWGIVAGVNLWRSLGWNTIIYLAAITGIDPSLYEAAAIDGASRYRQMWHITLAGIRPTIVILLIMNSGWLLQSGFELQWFLGSGVNLPRAENIDVFVLRYGIEMNQFGLATAAGIIRTVVSIALLTAVNFVAGRVGEERVF